MVSEAAGYVFRETGGGVFYTTTDCCLLTKAVIQEAQAVLVDQLEVETPVGLVKRHRDGTGMMTCTE